MAIAFDAVANPGGLSGASPSFSFTVGSLTNGLLWFGIFVTGQATTLNSVTWDSGGTNQAMTILTAFDAISSRFYLAYLSNPVNNGTYTLAYTLSGSVVSRPLAATYQGCKPTNIPDATHTDSNASNTSLSSALTTVADNCWHVGFAREDTNGTTSAGGGTTRRTGASTSVGWFDNNAAIHPAGSNTITFQTTPSSAGMAFYTASMAPFVASSTPGNFFMFM